MTTAPGLQCSLQYCHECGGVVQCGGISEVFHYLGEELMTIACVASPFASFRSPRPRPHALVGIHAK